MIEGRLVEFIRCTGDFWIATAASTIKYTNLTNKQFGKNLSVRDIENLLDECDYCYLVIVDKKPQAVIYLNEIDNETAYFDIALAGDVKIFIRLAPVWLNLSKYKYIYFIFNKKNNLMDKLTDKIGATATRLLPNYYNNEDFIEKKFNKEER